jgi:leader peptidase (prepilin peptidase) / N-methyltransferase
MTQSYLTQNAFLQDAVICFLLVVASTDLKYRRIPNALVFPTAAAVVLYGLVSSPSTLWSTLLGGAFGFGLFAATAWVRPGTLGGGDIKLAALIGLLFGFPNTIWALMVGIFAGGLIATLLLLTRRADPNQQIPYAPFLCLGALVALFYNPFLPFTFSLLGLK